MAEVKSEEVDQDKQVQVAYALPYDVVFSVEEITIKPSQLFTGKVVKSGNGASISFKKRFIGKEVYVIVKD
jgi:putative transposon-encoded protein